MESIHVALVTTNNPEREKIEKYLIQNGIKISSFLGVDNKTVDILFNTSPCLILLDLDLKTTDGIEVCYQLKIQKKSNSFVFLMSDKNDEYIQIEAYKVGADDFLIKPINPRVLLKKIYAITKRVNEDSSLSPNNESLEYKGVLIDQERYLLLKDDREISLPPKGFEILVLLFKNPNRIFTREEIFRKVWKRDEDVNFRVIDVHIRKIREKLGNYLIETVKGVGYRLAS